MAQPHFLNDPPMMPPMAGGEGMGDSFPITPELALARASSSPLPTYDEGSSLEVTLPAGLLQPNGFLVTSATVRELTGFDEEKLARFDADDNVAKYVTELLYLGVADLGGQKPTKDQLRDLLIGDRDALMLGIRRATYGDAVEFRLTCTNCDEVSEVIVELDSDVETVPLEDPLVRVFDVPLRHGSAKVQLMSGWAQEGLGNPAKKTPAELSSLLLRSCVVELNGMPTVQNLDAVRALAAGDRATLLDFISSHQSGPKLDGIEVHCATCAQVFSISLGLRNLFRM